MSKQKVLIVEDESLVALDIREALENLGYVVTGQADSGATALALARDTHPDLVLMDIMLKGDQDGIVTAQKIKEELHLPVVFLTAHADQATLERAKITEPFGYILKPFKEIEIRTVIELAIHRHKSEKSREVSATKPVGIPDFLALCEKEQHSSASDQVAILKFLRGVETLCKS